LALTKFYNIGGVRIVGYGAHGRCFEFGRVELHEVPPELQQKDRASQTLEEQTDYVKGLGVRAGVWRLWDYELIAQPIP
jgi:hypothetical protein